jgi:predicted outer membrane repeat protein
MPVLKNCVFGNNSGAVFQGMSPADKTQAGMGAGAVYVRSSPAYFASCEFRNNTVPDAEGGAAVKAFRTLYEKSAIIGQLTFDSCIFSHNKATTSSSDGSFGGAILLYYSYAVIKNCTFVGNEARVGGAINMLVPEPNPKFYFIGSKMFSHISDSTFDSNTAYDGGGGAVSLDQALGMTNCVFTHNSATEDGGAVLMGLQAFDTYPVTLEMLELENNSAGISGGAIAIMTTEEPPANLQFLSCLNGTWPNNIITKHWACGTNTRPHPPPYSNHTYRQWKHITIITLSSVRFKQNWAGLLGGGLFALNGNLTLSNASFETNFARELGAGAYLAGSTSLVASSSTWASDNRAGSPDGGHQIYSVAGE